MQLSGKVAIVTGAGRGIGKGCALVLAKAGAKLVLNDRPESPDLTPTAGELKAQGCDVCLAPADVSCRNGCEYLVDAAIQRFGRIDILISNPAVSIRSGFLEFDPHDFERVIAGTLTAGFHVSQLVARQFVAQGEGGKMLFISSVQAEIPFAKSAAYNAAKAGLNQLAATIACSLSEHRVNVNVIEPGWIDTPGERAHFGDERIAAEGPKLPWGRLGTSEDIGQAAVFLCSPQADYITGAVLRVDGGFWFRDARQ